MAHHKPEGIPYTKLLQEIVVGEVPSLYVTNTTCANCGDYGWCIVVVLAPSSDTQMSLVYYCGQCLVGTGLAMLSEPVAPHDGPVTVPIMRSTLIGPEGE